MTVKRKLIFNSIFAAIPRILGWFLTLFITPYIIQRLGLPLFGTWTLLSSLSSYLLLLDFGFATATARFVAEADAAGNQARLSKIFSMSMLLYACLGVTVVAGLLIWKVEICEFFRLEAPDASMLSTAYTAVTLSFVFGLMVTACLQMLEGLQKMNLSGSISSIGIIVMNILNIAALYLDYGIVGLAVVSAFINCMMLIAGIIALNKSVPNLKLTKFEFSLFKSMLKYGGQLQVSLLAYIVVIRTESPIISSILGSSAVGYYRLANSLAGLSRDISSLMLSAILPTATMLYASERKEEFQRLYTRASMYLTFFAVSVSAFFFCFSEGLLRLWLNSEEYLIASTPMRLMIIGFGANILTGVCTSLARAMGKAKQEMVVNLVMVMLHVSLNVYLLNWLGIKAIGFATALVLVPISLLLISILTKQLGMSMLNIVKQIFLPNFALVIGSSLAGLGVYKLLGQWIQPYGVDLRSSEFITLMVAGVVFTAAQLFLGIRFGMVRMADLSELLRRKPA